MEGPKYDETLGKEITSYIAKELNEAEREDVCALSNSREMRRLTSLRLAPIKRRSIPGKQLR